MFVSHISSLIYLQLNEVGLPLSVDGSAKASDGVPARNAREAIVTAGAGVAVTAVATKALVTNSDVVVGALVVVHVVERRVGEANGALAEAEALLVDTVQNSSDNGSRHGGSARKVVTAVGSDDTVVTESSNVREATAAAVVDTRVGGNVSLRGVVGKVTGVVTEQVVGDNGILVGGTSEDVGEATTRREGVGGNLGLGDVVQDSGTNGSDVRAAAEIIGNKDIVVRTLAVTGTVSDASVTTGDDDADAHETKLHKLVAFALLLYVSTGGKTTK